MNTFPYQVGDVWGSTTASEYSLLFVGPSIRFEFFEDDPNALGASLE